MTFSDGRMTHQHHTVVYHYRDIKKTQNISFRCNSNVASSGCTAKQSTAICVDEKIGDHYSEHSICHHKNWSDFISAFIFRSAFARECTLNINKQKMRQARTYSFSLCSKKQNHVRRFRRFNGRRQPASHQFMPAKTRNRLTAYAWIKPNVVAFHRVNARMYDIFFFAHILWPTPATDRRN